MDNLKYKLKVGDKVVLNPRCELMTHRAKTAQRQKLVGVIKDIYAPDVLTAYRIHHKVFFSDLDDHVIIGDPANLIKLVSSRLTEGGTNEL